MTPTQTVLAYAFTAANLYAAAWAGIRSMQAYDRTPAFRNRWARRWWLSWTGWAALALLCATTAALGAFGLPGLLNGLELP